MASKHLLPFFLYMLASVGLLFSPALALAAPPGTGWTQTFDDEFSSPLSWTAGATGGTWRTTYVYNGGSRTLSGNAELECYMDATVGLDPFTTLNGELTMTADRSVSNPCNLPYTSGQINTSPSFSQTYGYFEMRAKLPKGAGLWPAFWLLTIDNTWPPELDTVEMLGQDPTTIYASIFSTLTGTAHSYATQSASVADTSSGYHTYGADWEPDYVTYYFDDNQFARFTTPADMKKPMYLLIDLAVGGKWPGSPTASTTFPAYMNIDYVRAYSKPPQPSTAVALGARVKATANVNVRSKPGGGKILGTQISGAIGTTVAGPNKNGSGTWWSVNFDSGPDGWASNDYLTASLASRSPKLDLAAAAVVDLQVRIMTILDLLHQLLGEPVYGEPGTGGRP